MLILPEKSWLLASLQIQLLFAFGLFGILSVVEFVKRGNGTPVPFDPPTTLVETSPYAYLVNPMQFSTVGFILSYGWFLESWLLAAAGPMVAIYTIGIANPSEEADLTRRFGEAWKSYRIQFTSFIPRFKPIESENSATIYFAVSCSTCSQIRQRFEKMSPVNLQFKAAEDFQAGMPKRVTYTADHEICTGVKAIGKALVHINLLWALIGWFIQLPGISQILQVVVDLEGIQPQGRAPQE